MVAGIEVGRAAGSTIYQTEVIMRSVRLVTLGVATLCLAAVRIGAAQTSVKSAGDPLENSTRASEFEERAVELHRDVTRAAESARLHRRSAELRAASDPEAIESLALAAHLFGYAHQLSEARRTMEQAAERALAIGDVARAANAYLEAAFFAEHQKQRSEVERLGRKALLLAGSPLLPDDQRKTITDRIRFDVSLASLLQ